ncbi:MAG: hypothetical protein JWL76_2156 [Thermoleophilia bacterium]|nr:hypothetical protein [Thermoleophilia bacterium]
MVNGIDIAGSIRRAAQHLESAASFARVANEQPLPRLLFRGRATSEILQTYGLAVGQGRLAIAQLDGVAGPAREAMQGVDELLAKIDPAVARDRHNGLVHLRTYSETKDVAGRLAIRAERMRFIADHVDTDPATLRASLDAEVAAITGRPFEAVTADDVRRLAVIDGLPEPMRPPMPRRLRDNYGPEELVLRRMLPGSDNIARGEFEMHRLARVRTAMSADPTVTREALDAEVRAMIALPDWDITPEMVTRLSTIAGLGDDLRPKLVDIPVPWAEHRIADLSAWGWRPGRDGNSKSKFDAMRMAVEQEALLADPAVTRESVTRELVELLAIPDARLTKEQLYRTSILARLPEHLRPPLPPRLDHYAFEDLGLLNYHPGNNRAAAKVFDLTRIHMAAVVDPELTVSQLAERVRSGEPIDFRVLAALDGQESLLARHGLTPDALNREAVKSLATAGDGSKDALKHHLERVRGTILAIPANDPKLATIRAQALELADRNLDRMNGKRADTYSRHPDYAEVGRIVSIAELIAAVSSKAQPTPVAPVSPASGVADAAVGAAEVLTW